jgi:hypothetical protein
MPLPLDLLAKDDVASELWMTLDLAVELDESFSEPFFAKTVAA